MLLFLDYYRINCACLTSISHSSVISHTHATVVGVAAPVHGKEAEGRGGRSKVKLSAPPVSRPRRSFLTEQEARAAMGERTGLRSYYDSYEHVVDSHLRSEWDNVNSGRNYGRYVGLREGRRLAGGRASSENIKPKIFLCEPSWSNT